MLTPSQVFEATCYQKSAAHWLAFTRTYRKKESFRVTQIEFLMNNEKALTAFLSNPWINPQAKQLKGLKTYLGELRAFLGIEVEEEEVNQNLSFMDDLKEGVKYDPEGCQIFTSTGKHLLNLRGISRLTNQYGGDSGKTALYLDGFGYWLAGLINREVEQEEGFRYWYAVADFANRKITNSFTTSNNKHFSMEALREHFIKINNGGNPLITFYKELSREDWKDLTGTQTNQH